MHPPCELMVKSFLPGVRGLVAHELAEKKGLSQGRIAATLGVTQASVSQYLAKEPEFHMRRVLELGVDESEVDKYVTLLCEDLLKSQVDAIYTLHSIWKGLLARGVICAAHKREAPIIGDCDACMRLFGAVQIDSSRAVVLEELRRAVEVIEASPSFTWVMPEVSVNLVMALEGAKTESDVAGIPGRIVRVRGGARAAMPPEFAASHHMARILLTAMRFNPNIRAAIDIRFDERVEDVLREMRIQYARIARARKEAEVSDEVVVSAFRQTLAKLRMVPQAVIHEGSRGLEPITYLFAKDARAVAEQAVAISKRYLRVYHSDPESR